MTPTKLTPTQAIAKVLKLARSFIDAHYKEGPNNDTIFGKWYGANHQPWCAMYVSYCFHESGFGKLVAAQTEKGFAYCPTALSWYKKHGQLVDPHTAQAGDIAFFGENGVAEHTAIIVKPADAQGLTTYEGNTTGVDAGNQANGDGCYLRRRNYGWVIGVARPDWKSL